MIAPFFIGKDGRDLENTSGSCTAGKTTTSDGLAFWSPQAWVEYAILDMLRRIARKPMGDLLGGVVRRDVLRGQRQSATPAGSNL